ncbi:MAG TPA: Flp pilus assembly protein CpaB [Solirubrobacteraceae bacterium]|jgi:Flp pilus assembly protein CpaB|nr:Flp pilus assembly protein CpaB [Solirubrobacteraceae bacterium]
MELTGNRYTGNDWRRLLSTRRGTVIVAAVCTLVAAGILVYAAAQYRNSVESSGATRTVLVANATILKGTSGDVIASQELFHAQSIAGRQVSAGAIADTALLHGKVAVSDISPGQQLTLGDFTTSGGYAAQLAPDERVISIPLDASHGLAGVVQDGDRVDVYAGLNLEVNGSGGSGSAGASLRLLVANVPVLAVDQNSGGGLGGGGATGQQADVVLKVRASEAGALAFASDHGKIWLVLRGPNAAEPSTQAKETFNVQTLLRGTPGTGAGG